MMTFIEVSELKGIVWRGTLVLLKSTSYLNNIADDRDTRNMHASSVTTEWLSQKACRGFWFWTQGDCLGLNTETVDNSVF